MEKIIIILIFLSVYLALFTLCVRQAALGIVLKNDWLGLFFFFHALFFLPLIAIWIIPITSSKPFSLLYNIKITYLVLLLYFLIYSCKDFLVRRFVIYYENEMGKSIPQFVNRFKGYVNGSPQYLINGLTHKSFEKHGPQYIPANHIQYQNCHVFEQRFECIINPWAGKTPFYFLDSAFFIHKKLCYEHFNKNGSRGYYHATGTEGLEYCSYMVHLKGIFLKQKFSSKTFIDIEAITPAIKNALFIIKENKIKTVAIPLFWVANSSDTEKELIKQKILTACHEETFGINIIIVENPL